MTARILGVTQIESRDGLFRNVRFPPIADIGAGGDTPPVREGGILDRVSKRAPVIVMFTLCAALVGAWTNAPVWLAKGAAIVVGILALVLLAARKPRHSFMAPEAGTDDRGWLAQELAGKGTPSGSYLLGFFGFLTIALTGFNSPFAMLAWAGFALGVVWGIVNAHYPASEESEQ